MFEYKNLLRSAGIGLGLIALLSNIPVFALAEGNPASVGGQDKPEIFVQIGHTSSINSIDLSPDGRFVLSGSDDDSIKLWEAESGRLIRTFKDNDNVEFTAFLPGGRSFFSFNWKGNVSVWDIRTGEKIREFALSEMSGATSGHSVSYDGAVLRAIVGLRLYNADISRGAVVSSVEPPKSGAISGHLGFSFGSRNAISTDGRLMFSSVRESSSESIMKSKDRTLILWEIATGRILATLSGHTNRIDVVTLSSDNRYGLSGSRDKTVRLWDLKRGRAAAVFTGHQSAIKALAFSPDSKYVLSGSRDNTMKLWSVDDEKEIRTFAHDSEVTFVRFSPDGRYAMSGDDNGAIRYWDIQNGQEVKALKSHAADTSAFAYSADGNYLLTGSPKGQLRLWDAASGRLLKAIDAHREIITAVQFTPDGKYFLSASYDKTMKLWDRNEGKLKRTFLGHRSQVYKAVISPDGLYVLSAAQGNDIRLWNLASGAEMTALNLQGAYLWSIGFSADSRYLLIAHDQKQSGSGHVVKVLALDGREVKRYVDVSFGGYSSDGKYFLSREYRQQTGQEQKLFAPDAQPKKTIRHRDRFNEKELVDISAGKVLGRFGQSGAIVSVSVSAEPHIVLTKNRYDRDIRLWNVTSGREIRRFPVRFGLLTHDGKKIIVPAGKTLQVFDRATGHGKPFAGNAAEEISALALSAKGGYAVTGDKSGTMQFWDVGAGALLKTIKAEASNMIIAVAFSPDNQYAAMMARFGKVTIWNLSDGQKVSDFKTDYIPPHYDEVEAGNYVDYGNAALAFSPDNRHIACGPKLWDVATGRKVLDFQTPNGPGFWVTFSPDGAYLLSKNMLWDASTGRRVKKMESIRDGISFYSADGKTIYAADDEGAFSVIDPDTGKLIRSYKEYISGTTFAVSRDQKMMVAADRDVSELTLWNLTSGKKSAAIAANRNISSVELSADARRAMVNHRVSTAQYDLGAGKELAQFISFTDGEWIVITPEGYYNTSAGGERHLNVRVGDQIYGIESYREAFFRPDLVKVALSGGSLKDFRKLADVKQPPAVKIVDTPLSVRTDEVTVRLHLTDQGGGIGDVRLYLNGTAVVMDSRAVTIREKAQKTTVKTYVLKLTNGNNIIRAVAFNGDNSMQSNEATLEVAASYASAGRPSLSALVIGINQFKNPKLKLQYSVADADLFAGTLKTVSEGLFDKVTIKKLTRPDQTTSDAIIREIKSFQTLRPDDLFVFYIASHGTVDEGEYFLITSNVGSLRTEKLKTDAISQHMLKDAIANIPATKKLIIIDTCNAGALGQAIQVAMLTRGMSEDTALKILSRAVGSTILSASTSLQEALEGYQGHGLFTYVLTEGLKGKADKGKTGYIKTTELADYVDNEVPILAERIFKRAQYPTISISGQAFPIGRVR